MNRRSILKGIGAALGLAIADPAEALWKPGKLISIPKTVTPTVAVERFHTFTYDFLMNGNDRALSTEQFLNRFFRPAVKQLEQQIQAAGLSKGGTVIQTHAPGIVYQLHVEHQKRQFRMVAGFDPSLGDYGEIRTQVRTFEWVPRDKAVASAEMHITPVVPRDWQHAPRGVAVQHSYPLGRSLEDYEKHVALNKKRLENSTVRKTERG